MRWRAEVRVVLRDGIADPEGQTIAAALAALGFDEVDDVGTGKLIIVALEAPDRDAAAERVGQMCGRLLANPVIETFAYEVQPDAAPEAAA